jgi:hypothetical protein
MEKKMPKKTSRVSARVEREVRRILGWAKQDFRENARQTEEAVTNEIRGQLLKFKKTIEELIADADGKLRAELSMNLQEKVLPALSSRATDTMMSKEWMDAIIEKATEAVFRKTKADVDKEWEQRTQEVKNLAPTIFTDYVKSPDFIAKVVGQINALQLKEGGGS